LVASTTVSDTSIVLRAARSMQREWRCSARALLAQTGGNEVDAVTLRRLLVLFERFDVERAGAVDAGAFGRLLAAGVDDDDELALQPHEQRLMVRELDTHRDGRVRQYELRAWYVGRLREQQQRARPRSRLPPWTALAVVWALVLGAFIGLAVLALAYGGRFGDRLVFNLLGAWAFACAFAFVIVEPLAIVAAATALEHWNLHR
jgi:hypothetical protein